MSDRFRKRNITMQRALEQQLKFEHLKKELNIAKQIQASMLPHQYPLFPKHPQVDAAANMFPAKEVGGDFYDAFPLDNSQICIAIGDVSGKGIPAALFMVRVMTLLRSELLHNEDMAQAIADVNNALCQDNEMCMFVTLIVIVINVENGAYKLINAGHIPPLIQSSNSDYQTLSLPKGILLGLQVDIAFEMQQNHLNPGDMLLLFTDGVTEAMNSEQQFYSEKRLLSQVQRQHYPTAATLVNDVVNAVQSFIGGTAQFDDITLIAIKYSA